MKQFSNQAFTLAEVLITLGIIGVVAAMTIPSLMMNSQKKEFIVGWKKNYSVLSQATRQIAADNGSISGLWANTDNISFRNSFAEKLSSVKSCDNGTTDGCFSYSITFGRGGGPAALSSPALILKDGSSLSFSNAFSSCTSTTSCGYITIDVNGNKAPNLVGVDIFNGLVSDSDFLPYSSSTACTPQQSSSVGVSVANLSCSAEYLYNK